MRKINPTIIIYITEQIFERPVKKKSFWRLRHFVTGNENEIENLFSLKRLIFIIKQAERPWNSVTPKRLMIYILDSD